MPIEVRDSGTDKTVQAVWAQESGTDKEVQEVIVNDAGTDKTVFTSGGWEILTDWENGVPSNWYTGAEVTTVTESNSPISGNGAVAKIRGISSL